MQLDDDAHVSSIVHTCLLRCLGFPCSVSMLHHTKASIAVSVFLSHHSTQHHFILFYYHIIFRIHDITHNPRVRAYMVVLRSSNVLKESPCCLGHLKNKEEKGEQEQARAAFPQPMRELGRSGAFLSRHKKRSTVAGIGEETGAPYKTPLAQNLTTEHFKYHWSHVRNPSWKEVLGFTGRANIEFRTFLHKKA